MNTSKVTVKPVGAANLIAAVCKELQISRFVNSIVTWDEKQWRTSPGTLITGLVINILSERKPLYLVEKFYEKMDLPLLFDEPVEANCFNDDALGRALDRLSASDCKRLFQTVACQAVLTDDIKVKSIHADTTSISVFGQYIPTVSDQRLVEQDPDRELINITQGYSKQHRPDLKQFKCGLLVSSDGFPLLATVDDGNESDKDWNTKVFAELETSFLDPQDILYVADSELITETNLTRMGKKRMHFVSRLPERFKVANEVKEVAWQENRWEYLGVLAPGNKAAEYWARSFNESVCGRQYRLIVVRSSALDKRKERSIERQLRKEREQLEKAKSELEKEQFNCRPDAELILHQFLDTNRHAIHSIAGRIVKCEITKRRPGRPRKGEAPEILTRYQIELTISDPTAAKLQEMREKAGTFVLITTQSEDTWSNARILMEYKEQTSVETRFRFLKHPLLADGIFLKSTHRSETLAYVILLAVLVAAFIERRVRKALRDAGESLKIPGGRITDRPTISVILDTLRDIHLIHIHTDEGLLRILPSNTDQLAFQFLHLIHYDRSIYTAPPRFLTT